MMRMPASLLTLLLFVALSSGCASRREMPLDVALFPKTPVAADTRVPGRVAVLLQPAVQDLVHEGDAGLARGMRVPIGRIVASAMLASASEAFAGGVERLDAPVGEDARHTATLVVQWCASRTTSVCCGSFRCRTWAG